MAKRKPKRVAKRVPELTLIIAQLSDGVEHLVLAHGVAVLRTALESLDKLDPA